MLTHGGFTHCNSLSQTPISKSLLFPTKPHLNFISNQVPHYKLPSFHGGIRTGFCVFASKTSKKVDKSLFQVEEIEDDDVVIIEDDNGDEYDEDELFEDDDEGDDIDLHEMSGNYKAFLRSNKARGFGEGKVYDTSLEDKLLAKIEQSKAAQAANLNKLKNSPQLGNSKKDIIKNQTGKYKAFLKSNKPRGFGEGKVYDTSLEDKLLAEIEQSKVAQAAYLNKLKNSHQSGNFKKDSTKKQTAKEASPSGVPVRLTNLPRKKNIDRDLRAAFRGFPGILNIVPAVLGNKKTREPVCRGFAFVYFKSQNEAKRFVELFTEQTLTFGKIQKQIKCDVMKSSFPSAADKQTVNKIVLPLLPVDPSSKVITPQLQTNPEGAINDNVSKTGLYTGILDSITSLESADIDTQKLEEECATGAGIIENFTSLESIDFDSHELEEDSSTDADPLENQKENGAKGKNVSSKRKVEKNRKTKSLGSANRLKFKDKTLLSGIVSKYGAKPGK